MLVTDAFGLSDDVLVSIRYGTTRLGVAWFVSAIYFLLSGVDQLSFTPVSVRRQAPLESVPWPAVWLEAPCEGTCPSFSFCIAGIVSPLEVPGSAGRTQPLDLHQLMVSLHRFGSCQEIWANPGKPY